MALTIGQAAKASGVAAKTIRYYEQVGVLPPPKRTAAEYRQYTEHDVQRLVLIRRARALGLPLHHLKALTMALTGGPGSAMRPRLLELVRAHQSTVQRRISELRLLQRQLQQVRRRLLAPSPTRQVGGCRCLEVDNPSTRTRALSVGGHR